MTEPKPEAKRWSSPDSDVDPVLRSVLRYGRDLEPTSAQLGAIVAGATERARNIPARRKPRALWSIAAIAAVFITGAAFAGYAVSQRPAPAPTPATTPPLVPPPALSSPRRNVGAPITPEAEPPTPPEAAPADTAALASPPRTARSAAPAAVDSAPQVDPARDAQLLQEARSLVAGNPARALSLTRDHELHFPGSPLAEERQALRLEALARLGRTAEAAAALASFRTRFPRSIHARRLEALGLQ